MVRVKAVKGKSVSEPYGYDVVPGNFIRHHHYRNNNYY